MILFWLKKGEATGKVLRVSCYKIHSLIRRFKTSDSWQGIKNKTEICKTSEHPNKFFNVFVIMLRTRSQQSQFLSITVLILVIYSSLQILSPAETVRVSMSAGDWRPQTAPLMTRWAALVTPESPHPEYPRPTLVRHHWLSLNGLWDLQISG